MTKRFFIWLIISLGVVAIVGYCFSPAFAEEEITSRMIGIQQEDGSMSSTPLKDPEIFDDSFGQNYQYSWVPAGAFIPDFTAVFLQIGAYKYRISGNNYAIAPVNLPSGAYLAAVQFVFYDSSSSYSVTSYLYRYYYTTGAESLGSCGSVGTPGFSYCTFYPYHTIRNGDSIYQLWIYTNSTNNSCSFFGVRLFWKRQISPAPSAATFYDVPTSHPFFRYVEALAKSGITSGCGGGAYCPNDPVTRGQMAVFLSKALGLHWDYPY